MKKITVNSLSDFFALVIREKWWALIVFFCLFNLIAFLTYLLPDVYQSEELILIEPQDVPSEFVKSLTVGVDERLKALQETVLSRTNLIRIFHEFEKELPDLRDLSEEDQVSTLKSRINIEFLTESGKGSPIFSFKISSENQDPKIAQRITNRLSSSFFEYDNRNRKSRILGTTKFLEDELQTVAEQLKQAEITRRELKERYHYELPDQSEMNLRTLDRLDDQLKANSEALDRYVALRLSLERQISEAPPVITSEAVDSRGFQDRATASPLVAEYREKERAYKELSAKYTEKHPDVVRVKTELDRLKKELPAESLSENPQASKVTSKPNPVYQKLIAQLQDVKTEISIRERQRLEIQGEVRKYTQRLENSPQAEQSITGALREYEELNKRYDDLKNKLSQAGLARNLQSKQESAQFVILDAANLPLKPAKPNRLKLIFLGLVLSMGFGVVAAIGVDSVYQKLWTQAEVEKLFGVPVLVEIPELLSDQDMHRIRRKRVIETLVLIVAVAFCLVVLYSLHSNHQFRALLAGYFKPFVQLVSPIMSKID